MNRLSWGILSAGRICHDFVTALNDPSGPAAACNQVVAVAARQLDRAKTFAEKHGIQTVYGSYEELANDKDINVVYVGNITSLHYECCKLMLNHGKHILCEKTMTTSPKQSQELFDLAKSKNLFLMEAVWSNFFPTYYEIKKQISQGTIGDLRHFEASFGKDMSAVYNVSQKSLGGGTAFALGIYLINLVRLVFNREEPEKIIAAGDLYPSGIDSNWDAILVFKNNRRAVVKCSSTYRLNNTARITGTKGAIEIPDPFHCPNRIILPGNKEFSFNLPNQSAFGYNFQNSSGLSLETAAVVEAIRAGKLECEEYTADDTLYCARIMEEIQRQLGVDV